MLRRIHIREYILNNTVYRETIFPGYYITEDGVVAQIKLDESGNLKSFFKMKHEITKDGYCRVEINHKHYWIHRLVYQTWSGDVLKNDLVIDHIDANPQNNNIKNLRQITQKENIYNAIYHGNFGHNGNTKIEVYDSKSKTTKRYDCVKDFMRDIGAPDYMIRNGGLSQLRKRRIYNRYTWRKIDEH